MPGQHTLGITLPLIDIPLGEHRSLLHTLVEAGYTDVWTGEVAGTESLAVLGACLAWQPGITASCGVLSAFTRGPAVLAMAAATLGELAPGRARFGIGAGSAVTVEAWNSTPFRAPYRKVADTLSFLRQALAGGRAGSFRLARPVPAPPPKLLVGASGPRMQELAARAADGVVLNFVGPGDIAFLRGRYAAVERDITAPLEVCARLFVVADEGGRAEETARRHLAGYLTVPGYAAFQEWLGRGPDLAAMRAAWAAGRRAAAVEAIPDGVVRDLVLFGSPARCAEKIAACFAAGLDVATLHVLPGSVPAGESVEFLAEVAAATSALEVAA